MTRVFVNGIEVTKEEISKIEIHSEVIQKIVSEKTKDERGR